MKTMRLLAVARRGRKKRGRRMHLHHRLPFVSPAFTSPSVVRRESTQPSAKVHFLSKHMHKTGIFIEYDAFSEKLLRILRMYNFR
jgi:hypothetical protein